MNRHEEFDIDALASEHEFNQLSSEQRKVVVEILGSEEEYTGYRRLLLISGHALCSTPTPTPDPVIRRDLHTALRQRRRAAAAVDPSPLARLLALRIPAYQAALAMTAVVVAMLMMSSSDEPAAPRVIERIVQVPVAATETTTTIDREQLAQQIADSIIEKVRAEMKEERQAGKSYRTDRTNRTHTFHQTSNEDSSTKRVHTSQENEAVRASNNRFVGLGNLPQLASQKRGKSLAEDSAFTRFSVSMRRDTF